MHVFLFVFVLLSFWSDNNLCSNVLLGLSYGSCSVWLHGVGNRQGSAQLSVAFVSLSVRAAFSLQVCCCSSILTLYLLTMTSNSMWSEDFKAVCVWKTIFNIILSCFFFMAEDLECSIL